MMTLLNLSPLFIISWMGQLHYLLEEMYRTALPLVKEKLVKILLEAYE